MAKGQNYKKINKEDLKLVVENEGSSLTFHTRVELTNEHIEMFMRGEHEGTKKYPRFIKNIFKIPGIVDEIFLGRYELSVFKGPRFKWDEIQSKVEIILKRYVRRRAARK